ncbi:MAG TPA: enoyl-CoA hydratase/isomerase family protein [Thermoanaerobaculia bacterium]|nr:enoyl-CoA hydratase/isomerase family protein [Thermoanaerobaculia bacterium]
MTPQIAGRFSAQAEGRQLTIVFDDGGMNVLSTAALAELDGLIAALPSDLDLLILRSAREALFAAGADIREMSGFNAEDAERFSHLGQSVMESIARLPFLTLALIDGDCFGGALDLALAFDLRFATERSRFSHPGARLGIVTGFGGTSRWRDLLDRSAATDLFLANQIITSSDALRAGLVDSVVPAGGGEERDIIDCALRNSQWARRVKRLASVRQRLSPDSLLLLGQRLAELDLAESRHNRNSGTYGKT